MKKKEGNIKISRVNIILTISLVLFWFLKTGVCQEFETEDIVITGAPEVVKVSESQFYPIGFYYVPSPELARIKEGGFNLVQYWVGDTTGLKGFLDLAQKQGLKVLAELSHFVSQGREKKVEEIVTKIKDHPALFGWYIMDEPTKCSNEETIKRTYKLVKGIDPEHPTFLLFLSPGVIRAFHGSAEIFGIEPYPIPTHPLRKVMVDTRKAFREAKGKPLWVVIQCFEDYRPAARKMIRPLPEPWQARYMTYTAVANGAKGILYFLYKQTWDNKMLPDKDPALWEELCKIAAEIKAISPVLMEGISCREDVCLVDDGYTLSILAKKHKEKIYIIAVNDTDNKKEVCFKIKTSFLEPCPKIKVLFENRDLTMKKDGVFSDVFEKYEEHVYVIGGGK